MLGSLPVNGIPFRLNQRGTVWARTECSPTAHMYSVPGTRLDPVVSKTSQQLHSYCAAQLTSIDMASNRGSSTAHPGLGGARKIHEFLGVLGPCSSGAL